MIKFGTAGNPEAFYDGGGKSSLEMPNWLNNLGLNAYEYQCTRGVKISEDAAKVLGENAKANGISLSVHAPYYTNISSDEDERIEKTIAYILSTANIAHIMGAKRIVVHMGAAKNITRLKAMEITYSTIKRALNELDNANLGDVAICPETMGKLSQMGTLEEVVKLCETDERLIPTIDFGHLNSRSLGGLNTEEDYELIIKKLYKKLGKYRAENFHSHFSKIEFTRSGEKKHVTFENEEYGPQFEPLAKIIVKNNLTPTIICESAGTQAKDALYMKNCYEELKTK